MAVTLDDGMYALQRRSFAHAFDIFMLLAQDGLGAAEYMLAQMCADGQLTPDQLAVLIPRLDAESKRGNRFAAFNLGLLCERGLGVKKDSARAVEYYERAIQDGIPEAYLNLGNMYLRGDGVPRDPANGSALLKFAAEKGNAVACYSLGTLYFKGDESVEKSLSQAIIYFMVAAKLGHPEAKKAVYMIQAMQPRNSFQDELAAAGNMLAEIDHNRSRY